MLTALVVLLLASAVSARHRSHRNRRLHMRFEEPSQEAMEVC